MKYLLRLIIIPLVYLVCFDITSLGIYSIPNASNALKLILNIAVIALYFVVLCAIMLKEGEASYNKLLANNLTRKEMIRTGVVKDIDERQEYRWWKGYAVGLICCIPLIVILVFHFILKVPNEVSRPSVIAQLLYMPFFSLVKSSLGMNEGLYLLATAVTLAMLTVGLGLPYFIGAKKREAVQNRIKQANKLFHGEED